ncbi:unnamed protein product [Phytophthora fragariaefolia]|uniref:Unnamed protein product n=1 Tax=Phytophthora fragariaefolia TaxID=1490495 RepID=A0A9W7CT47_9STRA|nr:unnamed protein product [Phytophthora fragariaefolia]
MSDRSNVDAGTTTAEQANARDQDEHRLQLIVGPAVKNTVDQSDASGKRLEDFVANGATFKDILHKLWEKFRCHVKGMWANDITRNLDRSTWEVGILDPPTARVELLLRAADSEVELHIVRLTRSSCIALDCDFHLTIYQTCRSLCTVRHHVQLPLGVLDICSSRVVLKSIADNERLPNDWKAFGLRLTNRRQVLAARKESIEGFLEELPLPAATDVIDPLTNIENVGDNKHQE